MAPSPLLATVEGISPFLALPCQRGGNELFHRERGS